MVMLHIGARGVVLGVKCNRMPQMAKMSVVPILKWL